MIRSLEKIEHLLNRSETWDFSEANTLFAGVDVGTYKTMIVVVDETGEPRAAAMQRSEAVESGLIVDYVGALNTVKELMGEINKCCPGQIRMGATSYPPQTSTGNIHTTRHILEAAELEVVSVLDEPSAANLVLNMDDGAIVDVGGGTTGVAVMRSGKVVYTNDQATGGVHFSLVLAGALGLDYEEADRLKIEKASSRELFTVIRPVIEKITTIVADFLKECGGADRLCLVGGATQIPGMACFVGEQLGIDTFRPEYPGAVTPYGIALSCLDALGGFSNVH